MLRLAVSFTAQQGSGGATPCSPGSSRTQVGGKLCRRRTIPLRRRGRRACRLRGGPNPRMRRLRRLPHKLPSFLAVFDRLLRPRLAGSWAAGLGRVHLPIVGCVPTPAPKTVARPPCRRWPRRSRPWWRSAANPLTEAIEPERFSFPRSYAADPIRRSGAGRPSTPRRLPHRRMIFRRRRPA